MTLSHISGDLYCLRRVGGGDTSPGLTVMVDEEEAARIVNLDRVDAPSRAAEA